MATSRTCGERGWGQVAWRPGKPPVHVAARTLGALMNSSTRTGRRSTHFPLEGVRQDDSLSLAVGKIERASVSVLLCGRAAGCRRGNKHIPGEVKKVLDSLWSVVISLTSEVTLMRRPTTGGTLLKPSNLRKDEVERPDHGQEFCEWIIPVLDRWPGGDWMNCPPCGTPAACWHSTDSVTCRGGRQRSLRCVFQSRRSRRGSHPSLHLWTVCATRTRTSTNAQGSVLKCLQNLWPLHCRTRATQTQSFLFSAAVVSYFMGFSRACP